MKTKWREELVEPRAEIARLRERIATIVPTVHKDLSLISLVPKWSGAETATPLEEFISSIDGEAKIGRWDDADRLQVPVLRLLDPAKAFYNSNLELHGEDISWEKFKNVFRERFKDVHSDQFHFTRFQTARQAKNEGQQEFADRCRLLAQKVVVKRSDSAAQLIHRENADRMCLASFVAGLTGVPGRQVRFANSQTMQQALQIALSVTEDEIHERTSEIFFTRNDKPSGKNRERVNAGEAADSRASSRQNKNSRVHGREASKRDRP